jgi:hypothetical protein
MRNDNRFNMTESRYSCDWFFWPDALAKDRCILLPHSFLDPASFGPIDHLQNADSDCPKPECE